jgi:hypothetical protein
VFVIVLTSFLILFVDWEGLSSCPSLSPSSSYPCHSIQDFASRDIVRSNPWSTYVHDCFIIFFENNETSNFSLKKQHYVG